MPHLIALPETYESWMYHSQSNLTMGLVIFMTLITTGVTGARIYVRTRIIQHMGLDDWLAVGAWLFEVIACITTSMGTRFGLGEHQQVAQLNLDRLVEGWKWFYITLVIYTIAILFVKLTLLSQYYRVFAVSSVRWRYTVALVVTGCWCLSQIFVVIFCCTPIKGYWDPRITDKKCLPHVPVYFSNGAGNIITDFIVLLLPMPALRKLKLPFGQKMMLVGIFSLGFITVAISIIRMFFLTKENDQTWYYAIVVLWSFAEVTCALVCSNLPTLRPLLQRAFPGFFSRYTSTNAYASAAAAAAGKHSAFIAGYGPGSKMRTVDGTGILQTRTVNVRSESRESFVHGAAGQGVSGVEMNTFETVFDTKMDRESSREEYRV